MMQKVKMHDYPYYLEVKKNFSCFLKRDREWQRDILEFLNVLLVVQSVLDKKFSECESVDEYLEWCKTEEVVKIKSDAEKYATDSKAYCEDEYFIRLVDDLLAQIRYLLSDACINFYAET